MLHGSRPKISTSSGLMTMTNWLWRKTWVFLAWTETTDVRVSRCLWKFKTQFAKTNI